MKTEPLNKYEFIFSSGKCNIIPPKKEQIVSLATVVEKIKYDNLKLSKFIKNLLITKKGRSTSHNKATEVAKVMTKVRRIGNMSTRQVEI